jgi:hypothetical protein
MIQTKIYKKLKLKINKMKLTKNVIFINNLAN